jgi:phage shock protein PspC (stress-responsive transcriptional regulator)
MHRVVDISLSGHPDPYRLHEDAYEALARYLGGARARLTDDPDRDEVIGDLERSIGEKLAGRLSPDKRVVDLGDIRGVLEDIGAVDADAGAGPTTADAGAPHGAAADHRRVRRLYRIHEGEVVAGVCNGLATYADLNLDLVRWIVALLTIFTGGILGLAYIAAMFILPVVNTRQEYVAAMQARELAEGSR